MLSARAHLVEVTRAATNPARTARHAATMARVAQDRLARLEPALVELPDVAAIKNNSGAKDATPRVSTTDPDARVRKIPDGGFRPAFHVQLATTTDAARAIVGVSVTNRGSDQGQASPMLEPIEARTGVRPHRAARRWWLPRSRRHRSGHRRGRDPLRAGAQAAQQGVRDA
jgi:hypothetical protein